MKGLRWLVLMSVVLSACTALGTVTSPLLTTSPLPTAASEAEAPATAPAREAVPTSEATQLAAERLGVPATDLTLVTAEPVEWPDASLGCPQPGVIYAAVITPGWRFTFTAKEGKTVTLHTDQELQAAVLCDATGEGGAAGTPTADRVRESLAEKLRVAPETLTLISAAEVEWPDTSLGCPQPGMMYAQVITPGYQYRFTDQSGREYDVHTGRNPANFVVCEQKLATPAPAELSPTGAAAQRAIAWLAERQGISRSEISVVSTEAVEWPDSCLGCAEPGVACLTVIVPGYRVILRVGEARYEVRTNQDGSNCALCKS